LLGLPGWEPLLSFKGIYRVGSNFQYTSGSIVVITTRGVNPPWTGIDYIGVLLWFGDYLMAVSWCSETASILFLTFSTTTSAAIMLVREVELL